MAALIRTPVSAIDDKSQCFSQSPLDQNSYPGDRSVLPSFLIHADTTSRGLNFLEQAKRGSVFGMGKRFFPDSSSSVISNYIDSRNPQKMNLSIGKDKLEDNLAKYEELRLYADK